MYPVTIHILTSLVWVIKLVIFLVYVLALLMDMENGQLFANETLQLPLVTFFTETITGKTINIIAFCHVVTSIVSAFLTTVLLPTLSTIIQSVSFYHWRSVSIHAPKFIFSCMQLLHVLIITNAGQCYCMHCTVHFNFQSVKAVLIQLVLD